MDTDQPNNQTPVETIQVTDNSAATSQTPVASTPNPINVAPIQPEYRASTNGSKKKNLAWLWVTLSVVIIIASVTIGYFLVKNNVDKIADNYTVSLKSYLVKAYDDVSSINAQPSDVRKSLLSLNKPHLPSAFLSSLSSKYTAAQKLVTVSNSKLSAFETQANGYIAVYNYQNASSNLITKDNEARQSSGINAKSMAAYLSVLEQIKVLTDKVQPPVELKTGFTDISKRLGDMITAFKAEIVAYNSGDQVALKAADANFTTINGAETEAEDIIFTNYYNILSNNLTASVKNLKTYANSIE